MRILVVDDSRAMRKIVVHTLKRTGFEGATILEAESGARALEIIARSKPDLVLSDWNMPEMSGLELLRQLKDRLGSVLFGFVTTEATPEMRRRAVEAGAVFLIAKPFTVDSFQAALHAVLPP